MVFQRKSKSPLEARIKELEKESHRVGKDLKALSRALKNPDQLAHAPPRANRPETRAPASSMPIPPARQAAEVPSPYDSQHGELFAWAPRRTDFQDAPPEPEAPAGGESADDTSSGRKKLAAMNDDRFRNYFGNSSFLPTRPMKQEKQKQRNKAIFMVIFVLVFGFLLYKLLTQ